MARRKNIDKKAKVNKEKAVSAGSRFDISQETKNSIWGILGFSLAVLSVLSFTGKAGADGNLFASIARSLFGWDFSVVPLVLEIFGFVFLNQFPGRYITALFLGRLCFYSLFLPCFT